MAFSRQMGWLPDRTKGPKAGLHLKRPVDPLPVGSKRLEVPGAGGGRQAACRSAHRTDKSLLRLLYLSTPSRPSPRQAWETTSRK